MQTIDIICPVFQEEETIDLFHTKLSTVPDKLSSHYSCRIFYVVDPSRDRTEAILRDICNTDSRVEMLVMSRRFGHQLVLIAGIEHSRGDAVVMLDSDLQHPPSSSRSSWKFGRMALMLFSAFVNTAQSRTR